MMFTEYFNFKLTQNDFLKKKYAYSILIDLSIYAKQVRMIAISLYKPHLILFLKLESYFFSVI